MVQKRVTLAGAYNPRRNGLNLVRFGLASGVIFWHAFPLSGSDIAWAPLRQLVAEVWVDGFFAISGFLIVASWVRDPHVGRFLAARALRILPAFWVCLIATALVIAPVSSGVWGAENLTYVVKNAALWIFQPGIDGTPRDVPYPGVWNGSLWTLSWEFACYVLVMVLGLAGLLRYRASLYAIFAICTIVTLATSTGLLGSELLITMARFGSMFTAGAIVWMERHRLSARPRWTALSLCLIGGALFLPDYRVLGALPLAYLMIVIGARITSPRLQLRNDVSYGVYIYAFPVQQLLAMTAVGHLGVPAYAAASFALTLPLAVVSWFIVEKPSLRLKRVLGAAKSSSTARVERTRPAGKEDASSGRQQDPGVEHRGVSSA